jgi:hypothetical protein
LKLLDFSGQEEKKVKPNLFRIATSELSQDGFLAWLLEWADSENSQYNMNLHKTAQDFVRVLLGKDDYKIVQLKTGRHMAGIIDVWAEINDEYFVVIEDKTNTGEHHDQLERYNKIATEHYKDKNIKVCLVYLKTGNESKASIDNILNKGYKIVIVNRKSLLNIFNNRQIQNDIFNDFLEYIITIENETNMYTKLNNITTYWKAGEGFFLKIQELLNECSDWRYVSNFSGGFLGFWYHWSTIEEIGDVYIQIENAFENGIKLLIKIQNWNPDLNILYKLLDELTPIAKDNGLTITKPNKFSPAETSTVAIIQDVFIADEDDNFNLDKFMNVLHQLEKTIDRYCKLKNKTT